MASVKTLPLPEDPILAQWATALNDAGHWGYVLDATWRIVFFTDELRLSFGDTGETAAVPIGHNWFSTECVRFLSAGLGGSFESPEFWRDFFGRTGPYVLSGTPGGREGLRHSVDPQFWDLIDGIEPMELPRTTSFSSASFSFAGVEVGSSSMWLRIDDSDGHLAGSALMVKPAAGMSQLAAAVASADLGHLERMRLVERPDRRPAAILMADLESSSSLARRLSTAQFFAFGRRLVRAADRCVIDEGGIVGRHAGDGVVAFFLAETAGSESQAVRSCIQASRVMRKSLVDVLERSDLKEADVSVRFGLHWGATLYVGRILTAGRSEVTALGDEVNEAARIEACATGGRTLASKALVERLTSTDAAALGIDPNRSTYMALSDLPTATEKARRDAPSIAVCEI